MKKEFKKAMWKGQIVKNNTFETARGTYVISIIELNGQFYFIKSKNGTFVECVNLSKQANTEKIEHE